MEIPALPAKRYLVLGGCGYLGSEFARQAAEAVCMDVRGRCGEGFIKADLTRPFMIEGDYDWVIDCSGIVRSRNKKSYGGNLTIAKNVVEAARGMKLLYVSSIIVRCNELGPYGQSKSAAESYVREHSESSIILRPTYLYDIDRNNSVFSLIRMVRRHLVPFFYHGAFRVQPTSRQALARMILEKLDDLEPGETYEVGSHDKLTYSGLIRMISRVTGSGFVPVYLPGMLLRMAGRLVSFDVEGFSEDRVTAENELLVSQDLEGDIEKMNGLI